MKLEFLSGLVCGWDFDFYNIHYIRIGLSLDWEQKTGLLSPVSEAINQYAESNFIQMIKLS